MKRGKKKREWFLKLKLHTLFKILCLATQIVELKHQNKQNKQTLLIFISNLLSSP